jgi:threonine synthase
MKRLKDIMDGERFDDEGTATLIGDIHKESGYLLDTHSAIGVGAARARRWDTSVPMVCLATAHPAKFPDAVKAAAGIHPELPSHLSDHMNGKRNIRNCPTTSTPSKAISKQH